MFAENERGERGPGIRTGAYWPGERYGEGCLEFHFSATNNVLVQVECSDAAMTESFLYSDIFFGLVNANAFNIWFAALRFGPLKVDCPFHAQLADAVPILANNDRPLCFLLAVIHPCTGIVLGQRHFTVSSLMTRLLSRAIEFQLRGDAPEPEDFQLAVADFRIRNGTANDLMGKAEKFECASSNRVFRISC